MRLPLTLTFSQSILITFGTFSIGENLYRDNFIQKIDHFDQNNNGTWKQSYFYDLTYWNMVRNPIIFLTLGGEEDANHCNKSYFHKCKEYAKYFNAICVELKHRFYDCDHPSEILNKSNSNLISVDQVLSDIDNFITQMRHRFECLRNAKIILLGCSYPGTLATWFKIKYPDQVHGAIARSAPLVTKPELPEFGAMVKQFMDEINPECMPEIKIALSKRDLICDKISCDASCLQDLRYNTATTLYFVWLQGWLGGFCQNMTNKTLGTCNYINLSDQLKNAY